MNEFVTAVTRWTVRLVLLMVGVVFFLSLLAAACVLAAVWGVRALWAKLTGQPVTPWVMPLRGAASWAGMAQRAGRFGTAGDEGTAGKESAAPFTPPAGSKRGGILAKMGNDVSDVQPREVR